MTSHEPTHRKRELPQAELEATSNLKLGEFQNVPTLSLSEARLVITKVLDLRRKGDNKFEEREYVYAIPQDRKTFDNRFALGMKVYPLTRACCRALIKTQDYLEVFARFKEKENIEAVERLLSAHTELELFERSQLGMIVPQPSLSSTA